MPRYANFPHYAKRWSFPEKMLFPVCLNFFLIQKFRLANGQIPHCSGQVPATSGRSRVREEPHIQCHHLPGKLLQTETMKTVNKWIGYRRSLTWCWRRRKVAKSCAATIDSKDTARTWWTWSPNVWELNVTQFSVTGNEEGVERFIGANFVWGTRKIDFRVGQDAKATLPVSVLT